MKRYLFLLSGLFLLLVMAATPSPTRAQGLKFDPNNFHHPLDITNPYFPLVPGTTFIYQGSEDGEPTRDVVIVTHDTKQVDGITARVVNDTVYTNGQRSEYTFDWYAQDDAGNVWYMGEDTTAVGPPVSHEGSWEAGKKGAEAGIIMEANPKVGDTYRQEFLKGVAEDTATVLSLNESICVPYGCFKHELETKEFSALEPGVIDHKYYAPGIGEIKEITVKGGQEEQHLVNIKTGQ